MGTSTTTVATMVIIMLSINIGLVMLQEGVNSLTDDISFLNVSSTPYDNYITGGVVDGSSALDESYLPQDTVSVDGDNDDWNVFKQAKAWFKSSKLATSLSFVSNMFGQPAGFLRDIGVPNSIALGFQVIWGLLFLIFITAFIIGR